MPRFSRSEVENAFAHLWQVGCVEEDWNAWVRCFTPDVDYYDHFWGWFHGREEVQLWIDVVMKGVPEIYTVLDWYAIADDLVTFHCQNRRDNPDAEGPAYFDFPGLSIVRYAGDGLFSTEEDYWEVAGARRTAAEYAAACRRAGVAGDDLDRRTTRRHWPASPSWARTDQPPAPTWEGDKVVSGVTRPSQLYALLGRERWTDRRGRPS
jgi:hypothetical protein